MLAMAQPHKCDDPNQMLWINVCVREDDSNDVLRKNIILGKEGRGEREREKHDKEKKFMENA